MNNPYPHIIRLARSGSPGRAWSMMVEHGLLDSDTDGRALTLQARLVKDQAKRADGAERARLFGQSAKLYAKAGALDNGSYPLINAASLSLLAGKPAQSQKLARDVLAALDANPDEAETPYWLGATRAEALLLLGDELGARRALRHAVDKQPAAYHDHAATLGQFELLCHELNIDGAWLDQIRPPKVIQFCGLMHTEARDTAAQDEIASFLERENIGFGYGALAAGADIWIAEALVQRGGELHVILPCEPAAFREHSVTAVDFLWGDRFDRLMDQADGFTALSDAFVPEVAAVKRGDETAIGMALHHAASLRTEFKRLRVMGSSDPQPVVSDITTVLKARRTGNGKGRAQLPVHSAVPVMAARRGVTQFGTMTEAYGALQDGREPAVLGYAIVQDEVLSPFETQRLNAMLDCAEQGQSLATQAAAFALKSENPSVNVEVAGDMRWSGGIMPLFALN